MPIDYIEVDQKDVSKCQKASYKLLEAYYSDSYPMKVKHTLTDGKWISMEEYEQLYPDPWELRSQMRRELVLDFDAEEWRDVRNEARKLRDWLNKNNIPHQIAWSGGDGIHFHIFMAKPPAYFDKSIVRKYDLDPLAITRKIVIQRILIESGVDETKAKIDYRKITWNYKSKGSLIRDYGGLKVGRDGTIKGQKTLLLSIPQSRPFYGQFPLRFPQIEEWEVPNDFIADAKAVLDDVIDRIIARKSRPVAQIMGGPTKHPCYCKLMRGREDNINNGASTITLFGKMYNLSEEQIEAEVRQFSKNCAEWSPYWEDTHVRTMKSILNGPIGGPSCDTVRKVFGEDICDESNCPFKKH